MNFDDPSVINYRATFISFSVNNSVVRPKRIKPLEIIKCSRDMIKNEVILNTTNIESFFCLNKKDIEVGGYFDGSFVNFVSVEVTKCINNPNCKDINVIDDILAKNKLFLSFIIPETTISPNNYEKGLGSVPKTLLTALDPFIATLTDYYFSQTNMISDYGWITKEIKNNNILGFNYESKKNFKIKDDQMIINVMLFINKYAVTVTREYPKIQTLLAELGGILNFFIIFFKTLSNLYASFHLRLKLIKALNQKKISFEERKLNELQISKNKFNESLSVTKNNSYSNESIQKPNLNVDNKSNIELIQSNVIELKNPNNISINSNDIDRKSSAIELQDLSINNKIKPIKVELYENNCLDKQNLNKDKEKSKAFKKNLKDLDDLKQIEDKVDIEYSEPISMFMHLNFSCCFNKDKVKHYDEIYKEYDSYFEFHNLMLLDHKLTIITQTLYD